MLTVRIATEADIPAMTALMALAIDTLQAGFLGPEQVIASRAVMGLDSQLVRDRTYFAVEEGGVLAGCGGWSKRATLYGGDHSAGVRDDSLLDPACDPARTRAMYTHPDFTRRGVGRLILRTCEAAAAAEGYTRMELAATLSGVPLYEASGYRPIERIERLVGDVPVPLIRMGKAIG